MTYTLPLSGLNVIPCGGIFLIEQWVEYSWQPQCLSGDDRTSCMFTCNIDHTVDGSTATPNGAGSIGILVTKAFVNVFITATVSEGEF